MFKPIATSKKRSILKKALVFITLTVLYFCIAIALLQFMGTIAFYVIPLFSGALMAAAILLNDNRLFQCLAIILQSLIFLPLFLNGKWKMVFIVSVTCNMMCAYWFKVEISKMPMFQPPNKQSIETK